MSHNIWVFSIKVYAAAMVALWIAFAAAQQYPYWSMMVVYILALPTTGAMRQKALYMTGGSLLGATLGVLSSAVFAWSEIAQLVSMACLAATAGYFAMRDRLPSFYFFLLAALTCMLVALPGLTTPDQAFGRAVERVQDVVIGAGCMLVTDMLVFPALVGPQMITATDAWMSAMATWCKAALRGGDNPQALKDFFAKAATVDPVARQMRYEGIGYAWTRSRVALAMRTTALRLIPTVALLHDLSSQTESALFADIRERLAGALGAPLSAADQQRLRHPGSARAETEARALRQVAATWHRMARWRQTLTAPKPRWIRLPHGEHAMPGTLAHTDRRYAMRTSLTVLLFFAIMCLMWTFADWPSTMAIGLLLGTVFLIISGQADDPVPLLGHIFLVLSVAYAVDMLYLTVILPRVTSFVTMALVLAPVLLILGKMLVKPGGLLYAILPMALIRLGNTGPTATADMLTSFAAGIAVGLTTVIALSMLVRRLPPGEPLRRLRYSHQKAVLLATRPSHDHPFVTGDALDRLASIQARTSEALAPDIALVRMGAASEALRQHQGTLPIVAELRRWLQTHSHSSQHAAHPPASLLRYLDAATLTTPADATRVRQALIDMRLALASASKPPGVSS